MTRVAAVDCGTNSLRLLIADVDRAAGTLQDVDRRMEIVRLGQGVDATGLMDPAAMARALAVTADYAARCRALGVERVRFVATSATRDARNRDDFSAGVRGALGVEPEVIAGAEEARLSFVGATLGSIVGAAAPVLVVDIGGGSTEFVLGDPSDGIEAAISVDIGCVRLTERHLHSDPPSPTELAAATADVEEALDRVAGAVDLTRPRSLIGLAGSVTTVTAHALLLPGYDSARIHGAGLPVGEVAVACTELILAGRAERAAMPFMHPGRVDVIGAGALVWSLVVGRVARACGLTEVLTSEHDILDGIAWSLG